MHLPVVYDLAHCPTFAQPCVVTIGTFDGVHLGHQAVINKARENAQLAGGCVVALTFSNHPSTILRPHQPTQTICSAAYKYRLLLRAGADLVIALPFDAQLAHYTADEFLTHLHSAVPFSHLVLGHDARIGRDRDGDSKHMQEIAQRLKFSVSYLEPVHLHGHLVSSSSIRELITHGYLAEAGLRLGRQPTFFGDAVPGKGLGRAMGFPTLNLDVERLCLPPRGVYAVSVTTEKGRHRGIANLGLAPTVRNDGRALLEVFLFDCHGHVETENLEVALLRFIRPERKFDSLEHLIKQIQCDVKEAL